MKTFYLRVFEYIYNHRLELFQSFFYDLYNSFNGKHEEFFKSWFEKYTLRKLLKYFPIEEIINYYPQYVTRKRNVVMSYIKTYWGFCEKPSLYTPKVRESMNFFGIKELTEKEVKRAYRRMVKAYHPDNLKDKTLAHKKMLLINYHYQVLLAYIRRLNHA